MTLVVSTRSHGVGDVSKHLVRRTDVLAKLGSIIFCLFATLWRDALLHSGLLPAIRLLRRPAGLRSPR
jgi:hypothetical protein